MYKTNYTDPKDYGKRKSLSQNFISFTISFGHLYNVFKNTGLKKNTGL